MNSILITSLRHIKDYILHFVCLFHTKNNVVCYMPCRYAKECDLSCKFNRK